MPDPRLESLAGMVARVEGAACWLARLATRGAIVGGGAGAVLWWVTAGHRVDDWWQGTVGSVLVLLLCVAAPAWLVNVRSALHDLVKLPEKLAGVTTRRAAELRGGARPERPDGGTLQAMRSVRSVLSDYGDVVGSWGTIAQLLVPSFWLLTAAALLAVPVLVVLAAVAGLVDLYA